MILSDDNGLVRLAQYLAGISAHQSVWKEITHALVQLLGVEVAAVAERDAESGPQLAHWSRGKGVNYSLRDRFADDLESAVVEVLDSGFFTSRRFAEDQAREARSWQLLFFPMMRGNQIGAVLLIGERREADFSKQELDFHLAIAGLAAVTAERLTSERELQHHRAHLEELVAQRSGELLETNRRLQKEVTQRHSAEIALRAEKDNLLRILEAMDDFVLIIGADRSIHYINPAIKSALGDDGKRLCHELLNARSSPCPNCRLSDVLTGGGMQRSEWNCSKNDRIYDRTMTALEDAADAASHATLVILRDITERKRSEDLVRQMAYHDGLTGLPNRMLFQDRLSIELARAERHATKLALMMLDLDKFKVVNDTLGHHAGDQLLREASRRMRAQIRSQDTVARTGGDEFMLILPDLRNVKDATLVAGKLVEAFLPPFELGGHSARVTASIGISLYPDQGLQEKLLLELADRAMYDAKRLGRSGYRLATAATVS